MHTLTLRWTFSAWYTVYDCDVLALCPVGGIPPYDGEALARVAGPEGKIEHHSILTITYRHTCYVQTLVMFVVWGGGGSRVQ
jgi:hypothetical protein